MSSSVFIRPPSTISVRLPRLWYFYDILQYYKGTVDVNYYNTHVKYFYILGLIGKNAR